MVRSQDVRQTEKDKVRIGDCFRGGDIVKGTSSRPCILCTEIRMQVRWYVWICADGTLSTVPDIYGASPRFPWVTRAVII